MFVPNPYALTAQLWHSRDVCELEEAICSDHAMAREAKRAQQGVKAETLNAQPRQWSGNGDTGRAHVTKTGTNTQINTQTKATADNRASQVPRHAQRQRALAG